MHLESLRDAIFVMMTAKSDNKIDVMSITENYSKIFSKILPVKYGSYKGQCWWG